MATLNVTCWITRQTPDAFNLYGEPSLDPRWRERCGVVRLRDEYKPTTVRADSGGSRGYAEEATSDNRILLASTTRAQLGDKLEVAGVILRIMSKSPRYDVTGRLDHYEVAGERWA